MGKFERLIEKMDRKARPPLSSGGPSENDDKLTDEEKVGNFPDPSAPTENDIIEKIDADRERKDVESILGNDQ